MKKLGVFLLMAVSAGAASLTPDQTTLLQDSSGWEILKLSDVDSGVPTTHVCFDGNGRGACRGTLLFRKDGTFVQMVNVHGQQLGRQGQYDLTDDGILFHDEFGYKDGPYTATFDALNKTLALETTQAVKVRMDLLLESEYRKQLAEKRKNAAGR